VRRRPGRAVRDEAADPAGRALPALERLRRVYASPTAARQRPGARCERASGAPPRVPDEHARERARGRGRAALNEVEPDDHVRVAHGDGEEPEDGGARAWRGVRAGEVDEREDHRRRVASRQRDRLRVRECVRRGEGAATEEQREQREQREAELPGVVGREPTVEAELDPVRRLATPVSVLIMREASWSRRTRAWRARR
jgi:hypothetical protein